MIIQKHLLINIGVDFYTGRVFSKVPSNRIGINVFAIANVPEYNTSNGVQHNKIIFGVFVEGLITREVIIREIEFVRIQFVCSVEDCMLFVFVDSQKRLFVVYVAGDFSLLPETSYVDNGLARENHNDDTNLVINIPNFLPTTIPADLVSL